MFYCYATPEGGLYRSACPSVDVDVVVGVIVWNKGWINQYSRSRVSPSLTAKIDQNKAQHLPYSILWIATYDFFDFLDLPKKYLANATFGTSLAFQMSVLERLEKLNLAKNHCFWPTLKERHPVEL